MNELEVLLGYEFKDKDLLTVALTHASYGSINNERLEFLGDSILSFVISQYLYKRFAKAGEGALTRMRAALVKKDTLVQVASKFKLFNFIRLGVGEMKSAGLNKASLSADALEAIMGAIFLDSGEVPTGIILEWFGEVLTEVSSKSSKDAKTKLQEHLQQAKQLLPHYSVINITGQDHCPSFTVHCKVGELVTEAAAMSIKIAEQKAAALMLDKLTGKNERT